MIDTNKQWFGFLEIPEGKAGDFAVNHKRFPAGHCFHTATARNQIFGGHKNVKLHVDHEVIVHELTEGGGVWMTDLPIEQVQHDVLMEDMYGRILVGGLGLGYAAQTLSQRSGITEVVVIEKSQHVIDLVANHLKATRAKLTVIRADLHEWLVEKANREFFDWCFFDIWQPDGELVFFKHVVPLRKKAASVVYNNEHVRCWNEDIMRGQLMMGLHSHLRMLDEPHIEVLLKLDKPLLEKLSDPIERGSENYSFNFGVPFFRAIRDKKMPKECWQPVAQAYVRNYGIPGRDQEPWDDWPRYQ